MNSRSSGPSEVVHETPLLVRQQVPDCIERRPTSFRFCVRLKALERLVENLPRSRMERAGDGVLLLRGKPNEEAIGQHRAASEAKGASNDGLASILIQILLAIADFREGNVASGNLSSRDRVKRID